MFDRGLPAEECICDQGWRKSANGGCEWDCSTVDSLGCIGPGVGDIALSRMDLGGLLQSFACTVDGRNPAPL